MPSLCLVHFTNANLFGRSFDLSATFASPSSGDEIYTALLELSAAGNITYHVEYNDTDDWAL